MGTWSTKLFDDDEAADIRLDFEEKLEQGKSPMEAGDEILAENSDSLADPDSGPVIIMSLAYLLHQQGVQSHPVIVRALSVIEAGEGLERWAECGQRTLASRKRVYEELRQRLQGPPPKRAPKRKRTRLPKLFDVIEFHLPDGRYAYGQYVFFDDKFGPYVQAFRRVSSSPVTAEEAMDSGPLFPPVIVGINPPVRAGKWKIIANIPVAGIEVPPCRYASMDREIDHIVWFLRQTGKSTRLGTKLSDALKELPLPTIYAFEFIEEQIMLGRWKPNS